MSLAWAAGTLLQQEDIRLPARNRGLTLGDGLFETFLVVNRTALWRDDHLARMKASADVLGVPFLAGEITTAIDGLLAAAGRGAHVLRLTLTRGATARGLAGESKAPFVLATLDPFDTRLIGEPATLVTSAIRRSAGSIASTHKTLSYVDAVVAARAAVAAGADDALMLNGEGRVASSTIANIFVVKGTTLITPARTEGILPGIMRQVLLREAGALGLTAVEAQVTPETLRSADGVFLTNSLRIARPVVQVDGQALPVGDASRILDHLCACASGICGGDPRA